MIAWWIWAVIGIAVFATATFIFIAFTATLSSNKAYRRRAAASIFDEALRVAISIFGTPQKHKKKKSHHTLDSVVREAIKAGVMMLNIPVKMVQGQKERVEVKIARSTDLRDGLLVGLRGSGEPQIEEIGTSLYMEVQLAGPTFEVICHSPAEQLIIPTPACWEFDVLPCRAGRRQITLNVSMRIEAEGIVGGRRGVSVLHKHIDVQVNIRYATHRFVAGNWQWLIPTVLALAGTVAAWLVVPF